MSQRRRHVPLKVKLEVAFLQIRIDPITAASLAGAIVSDRNVKAGPVLTAILRDCLALDPPNVRLDHHPLLAVRERTADGGYIPDELDPRYMQWLSVDAHQVKTTGRKATTAGSDIHAIAKVRRLRGETKAKPKRAWPKGRKIQSRGFQKRKPLPPQSVNGG